MSVPAGQQPTGVATGVASGVPGVVLDDPKQLIGHTIVGRFRVDGVLGIGGMGAVLRCHHLGLQRDIAVKVLHPEMSSNPEIAARFAREAQAMSRMNHPNCVRVLDFGEFDVGGPPMQYLAMEILAGCELSDVMKGPLPPLRAAELMDQVFSGLSHAHAAGIVHRDLKPENVFVTTDHEEAELLKIVDFGIAKIVSGQGAKDNMTVAGTIFGTPRYMSPEQCAGGEIDARTDVYAAGIILYEMLAGHVPFDNPEDPVKVIHRHILEPVPPLPSTVPVPMMQLVMGMLEKEKASRVASIDAAQERLSEIRRGLVTGTLMAMPAAAASVSAPAPTMPAVPAPAASAPTSDRVRMAAIGAVALVAVAGIAYALGGSSDPQPAVAPVAAAPVEAPPASAPTPKAPPAVEKVAELLAPTGADDSEIAKLDAMLADGATEAAEDKLRQLLDDFPKDAQLHLRNGRLLRETDAVAALAAYGRAIELDSAMLDDEGVREELLALMRRKKLAEPALDLAIRQLGEHGVDYLVQRVNDDARPVPYADRLRALKAIDDAGRTGDVESELNVALGLWQAGDATDPCAAYAGALGSIEAEPAAYYLGSVMKSTPPAGCDGLTERRGAVGQMLQAKFAIPESDWVVPAAYVKKRGRRGRRSGGGGGGGGGGLLRRIGIR